jgi:hypothetical protein
MTRYYRTTANRLILLALSLIAANVICHWLYGVPWQSVAERTVFQLFAIGTVAYSAERRWDN